MKLTTRVFLVAGLAGAFFGGAQALAGSGDLFGNPQFYGAASGFATAAGDFDGDGDTDLVIANPPKRDGFGSIISHGDYVLYRNNPMTGMFTAETIDADHGGYAIVAGDLNGDHILDLVSSNTIDAAGNITNVLIGNGDGTFAPIVSYGGSNDGARAIALGDMDNDGDLDIVLPNGGRVLLNNGDGTFATNFVGSDVQDGGSITLGDINEDGHLDIVTSRDFYNPNLHTVSVQFGVGDGFGNPGPAQDLNIGGASPHAVRLADVNNDMHLDLVTINQASIDASVLLGDGSGIFSAPATFPSHPNNNSLPNVFLLADLDADGNLDAAVTSTVFGAGTSQQETVIFLGDGNGSFTLEQIVERFGLHDQNIVAATINDDAQLDLVTAAHLLYNQMGSDCPPDVNGDGTLDSLDLITYLNAFVISDPLADFNGDGLVNSFDFIAFLNAFVIGC